MKKTLLIVFTAMLFSNSFLVKAQEKSPVPKVKAIEGVGIEGIQVGVANLDNVIGKFGNSYKVIKHSSYSEQIDYSNLGLSFYYCQTDRQRIIFAIQFRKPFEIITSRGIILGESRVKDVLSLYGRLPKGDTSLEYTGIDFRNVNLKTNEANVLNDGEMLINEINIYSPGFISCDSDSIK